MENREQKITPNLWFDNQAEEAARYYISFFDNSRLKSISHYGAAGARVSGRPEGSVLTVEFEIEGQKFIALNGGPMFKLNPSISFLVACDSKEKVDTIWGKLHDGGRALMDLGTYPFSERYGWTEDRYGLSWQVMYIKDKEIKQKITPTLMFTGAQTGKAEEAIHFYASIFHNSGIGDIARYGQGEGPDKEGTIKHASFTLEGQEFAAMDSARDHNFTFNEAISLMVECENQNEIDYYWDKLTAGGQESVCGWLKDKFGVSWQVSPAVLGKMLLDPDKAKVERVTEAYLKMKKFNLAELMRVFEGQ